MVRLAKLGEFGLIDLLNKNMLYDPEKVIAGIGDDAAVLKPPGTKWQLLTTDMMMENIHFRLDWSQYYQVGYKALAVNISDVAAMGGYPSHAVVSVGIPEETRVEDIEELYRGLKEMACRFKVNLVGGDTVKSPGPLVINIALMGEVEEGRAVFRSGAKPGDLIYTTGFLGTSAAGLYILSHNGDYPVELKEKVIRSHLLPEPRVAAARILSELEGVTALDDNSDGLAAELREICRASSAGCLIREKSLPVLPEVEQLACLTGRNTLDWIMDGGEDYELLFTLRPERQEYIENALGKEGILYKAIGIITHSSEGMVLEKEDGAKETILLQGYSHF
ncbi:thiamine-phosphate kinase [Desulforamulus reducens MI-1]|uniref:Thiamine-monophosphate kinase n=1 Tax=Desulforamulus reducens (strain ATCC BAA-1160 / DSM 100696 / MI-1) TaxID=349161 RepID=A4J8J0_DESRM|nr:thiamine-phosphate kinase [Desulforamulus reducens]ABO51393.1 thiamine-phosphate kinase [Desulforamulus reducens MI-1]